MKRIALVTIFVCSTALAATTPTTVTCKDGTMSPGGRGACRGHGGVDKTKPATPEAAAPASSPKPAAPAAETTGATVTCKDGATSKAGRGACRGHGGVDKTASTGSSAPSAPPPVHATPPAAKAPTPPAAQATSPAPVRPAHAATGGKAATDDPAGAIARCKDGKFWHGAGHRGACSHHGGVDGWLDGTQAH